jgi:predicted secreted protein
VGRTCLDSIQELRRTQQNEHEDWRDRMNELRDTQAVTDEKLNILIDTVDRDRGEKG